MNQKLIIIFAKTPQLGKVKTRLRPFLTDQQCLTLHVAMLNDTFLRCASVDSDKILYLSEQPHELPFELRVPVRIQVGKDLGDRMANAFQEMLPRYQKVLVIGTDCPFLSPDMLQSAFGFLDTCDVVVGPTLDGGYSLIGMRTFIPEAFDKVSWSTHKVLEQTLEGLKKYQVGMVEETFDVDEPRDLSLLKQKLALANYEWLTHLKAWATENQ